MRDFLADYFGILYSIWEDIYWPMAAVVITLAVATIFAAVCLSTVVFWLSDR